MASTYTVTRQAPDQYDFSAPGDPVIGTVVYFVTGDGNQGSVFVPNSQYRVATVRTMVAAKAKLIDEVAAIEGTSP